MNNPFIAFYPSKWLARAAKLTAVERGVFITLICEMYESQAPIKYDPKRLARFCGTTPATLKKCVEELLQDEHKLILKNEELWNYRVEKELKTAQKKSENQSKNSRVRWEKHNKNNESAMPRDNPRESLPDLDLDISNKLDIKKYNKKVSRFEEFWQAFDDKRGKANALKVWKSKKLDDVAEDVISGAKIYVSQIRGEESKYWKQAQGWLNGERWHDEPQIQTTNVIGLNANSKQAPSTGMMFLEMAKRAEEMGQ